MNNEKRKRDIMIFSAAIIKYTLIELLAVVPVIVILAGLLLPALNQARCKASLIS